MSQLQVDGWLSIERPSLADPGEAIPLGPDTRLILSPEAVAGSVDGAGAPFGVARNRWIVDLDLPDTDPVRVVIADDGAAWP